MQEHHASASASAANVLCPNVLELGVMTRTEPRDPAQVLSAARQLLDRGPRLVLVKHLAHAGLDPERAFEMLLVARSAAWHVATPLLPFSRPPVGVGDLTSGLFLANLLHGKTPPEALEHTASAYFAVMQAPCVASYTITPSPACTRPGLDAACLPAHSPGRSRVSQATAAVDAYELQLVAAQDDLVAPRRWFEARPLPEPEPS